MKKQQKFLEKIIFFIKLKIIFHKNFMVLLFLNFMIFLEKNEN